MFPVKCKELLPLDHILIKSVAVRGRLGPLTVWVSNPDEHGRRHDISDPHSIRLDPRFWTKLYDKKHSASRHKYKELELDQPIRLVPGETRVIYVHSTLPGDEAIVYDDSSYYAQSAKRFEDGKILIMTGRAHVSCEVFGENPIWGWGNAWRDRREFVGRLNYGTVYKLWNPKEQPKFGGNFQDGARTLVLCQRRWESPMSRLPDECIYYILNLCRWDWFNDDVNSMKLRRKREKMRSRQQAAESQNEASPYAAAAVATATHSDETDEDDVKMPHTCTRRGKTERDHSTADEQSYDDEDAKQGKEENDEDDGDDAHMDEEEVEDQDDGAFEAFSSDDDEDEEEDDEDDEDMDDEEAEHYGYAPRIDAFTFQEIDSSDEENEEVEPAVTYNLRRTWVRRQIGLNFPWS